MQGEGRVNLYLRVEKQQKEVCQSRGYREKVGLICTCGWRNSRKRCVRAGGAGRRVGNSVGEGIQSLSKN